MRRAAKIDVNQPAVIDAFRRMGCAVMPLHRVGAGCPDLLVARNRINLLVEIKAGKRGRYTRQQEEFNSSWPGECVTVWSVDDVVSVVNGVFGASK